MLIRIVLIFASLLSFSYSIAHRPDIGDIAPEIETSEFSLSSAIAKKKVVVLYFYPKDNTPNCTVESMQFAARFNEFNKLNVEIVGVSSDSHDSHVNFKKKYNIPFNLICDEDKKIIKAYDVGGFIWPQRVTFLINRQGRISYIWPNVNVSKHAQEVINKITELGL